MTRYTPDAYDARVRAWMTHSEGNWASFPVRTPQERRQRYVSDCERAVLTLLEKAVKNGRVHHPILRIWIQRHLQDEGYSEPLPSPDEITREEWVWAFQLVPAETADPTWRIEHARANGWWVRENTSYGRTSYELTYPSPEQYREIYGDAAIAYLKRDREMDDAAVRLLYALQEHREQGEEGATTTSSLGFGIAVTTSLAAAIVEYHERILNVWSRFRQYGQDFFSEDAKKHTPSK